MKEEFGLNPDDLTAICNFDRRTEPALLEEFNNRYGGVRGVAEKLNTDLQYGLTVKKSNASNKNAPPGADGLSTRREVFGENIIPPPRSETILELVWGTIVDDPILKILIAGAAVVMTTGTIICPATGWTEGLAILIAVVIVLTVTAGNDWTKDRKFKKLLLLQTDKKCRVIRNGRKQELSSWDILVGDMVELLVGDEIPADGIYYTGNRLVIDESPLTGESQPVKKNETAPFLFSGCQVVEGSGVMLTTSVGVRSSGGRIQELLNEAQNTETVLQEKLKDVAIYIGKIGVGAGIVTFLGLALRWAIDWANGVATSATGCGTQGGTDVIQRIQKIAEDFVVAITVIVVAVPEGLPLAVTLSLSLSMFKMMRDKCFVRHLDASETMGQATTICTDKTGTLTYNRMSVVKIMIGSKIYKGEGSGDKDAQPFTPETIPYSLQPILTDGICINSNCFIKNEDKLDQKNVLPKFVGSATEGALLMLARKFGVSYRAVRDELVIVKNGVWAFSAETKRMSTMIERKNGYRLFTKGASEVILDLCTHMIDPATCRAVPMDSDSMVRISETIKAWAADGLRTLALAYKDLDQAASSEDDNDPAENLCFVAIVAIKDPIRKEIPSAVTACQRAGLVVRMVTGDNILTASKIARECNILNNEGIAMEGPVFRSLPQEQKELVAKKLQVLARCSPNDKYELVSILKSQGEVVAVTGDGTNDAPALKEADVGFSMGISGTQIAMNASDIVLLDDNFASIVQSIRWGRNVLESIRKFIQFQLGINLAAILVIFIGSVTYGESPLTTVQLLWINLIMDSFGALGLASDEPDHDILEHPPQRKTDPILTPIMQEYIFLQTVFQTAVCLCILFGVEHWFPADTNFHGPAALSGHPSVRIKSLIFTAFIFLQLTNIISARQLNSELSIFGGFFRNKIFLGVLAVIIAVQVLVVNFGSNFIGVDKLDAREWIFCIAVGIVNLPVVFVFRFIANAVRAARHEKMLQRKVDVEVGPSSSAHFSKTVDMTEDVVSIRDDRHRGTEIYSERSGSRNSLVERVRKIKVDQPLPVKQKSFGSLHSLK